MSDTNHIPDPVKGVINAFHKGSILTKRICKAARNALSTHTLKTLEPAQELERSLLTSEDRVKDAYAQGVRALGQGFAKAILNDRKYISMNSDHELNCHFRQSYEQASITRDKDPRRRL